MKCAGPLLLVVLLISLVGFAQSNSPDFLLWRSDTLATWGQGVHAVLGVGDVTGDGIPDIVCDYNGSLIYYQGKGDGTFTLNSMAGDYELVLDKKASTEGVKAYTPVLDYLGQSGALGDFNGDGDLDLAVVAMNIRLDNWTLFVLKNEYHGHFTTAFKYVLGKRQQGSNWRIWARDVNGDGNMDLILASETESATEIYIMYGDGKLSFTAPEKIGEAQGNAFFCGDANGDSHLDVGLRSDHKVTVLLGDGKGKLDSGPTFTTSDNEKIYDASLCDLNGNGIYALVLALGKQGIAVARQTEQGFTVQGTYPIGEVWDVKCADFTGNGVPDVLTWLDGKGWVVLPGDGTGKLGKEIGGYLSPPLSQLIWVGDLNDDRQADLLFTDSSGELLIPMMDGGTPHGEVYLPMGGSQLLAVGDVDGDGSPDLVAEGSAGLDVYYNRGAGLLERKGFTKGDLNPVAGAAVGDRVFILNGDESGTSLLVFSNTGKLLGNYTLGTDVMPVLVGGDFDGDGQQDVASLAKRAIFVLWGGSEDIKTYYWKRGDLSVACGGDFDNDGKDELSLISTAEYADMYTLSFPDRRLRIVGKPLELKAVPLAMASGDIDGDGIPDPVAIGIVPKVSKEADKVTVSITGGLLGMILSRHGPSIYQIPDYPTGESPWPFTGLAVGDVTGDGVADVAFSLTSGHGECILPGKGNGGFEKLQRTFLGLGPLFAVDIDDNGQLDLVGSTLGFEPEIVIRYNGGER